MTATAMTFRVRCLTGEFEYADHRCHARLRIRWKGKAVASRRAIVDLQLVDYEYWESDFGENDERGDLYWRIQLAPRS